MKQYGIDTYSEIQQNKTDGASLIVSPETEQKFLQSEDGYGRSTATGNDQQGDEVTISTRDSEQDAHENLPNDEDEPEAIMNLVNDKLAELKKRTLK